MILLDTNVLSALMHERPDPRVVQWLNDQPPDSVWTTSITVFEVAFGLATMADGRRKAAIEDAFQSVLRDDLQNRIAAFDSPAAREAARLAAERQRAGRPVDFRDMEIAGIAISRRATLATRNLKHFRGLSIPVLDPWSGLA
ncbi:type II toxin-antitoxin system VapC family toxin [Lichenicoccus sp.]|uniref:type II toxin-antitoxin system VapC family toxin n=1 Tax=Lichenicoccus sp. TaxID=2781899 RepID=UPI003D0C117F